MLNSQAFSVHGNDFNFKKRFYKTDKIQWNPRGLETELYHALKSTLTGIHYYKYILYIHPYTLQLHLHTLCILVLVV